jgi:hypothetical protein
MKPAIAFRAVRSAALSVIRSFAAVATVMTANAATTSVALAQNEPFPPAAQAAPLPPPAQNMPPPPAATDGRAQAPIGHRQPRPRDLPPDVSRDENGIARSPMDRELDQRMRICRDC